MLKTSIINNDIYLVNIYLKPIKYGWLKLGIGIAKSLMKYNKNSHLFIISLTKQVKFYSGCKMGWGLRNFLRPLLYISTSVWVLHTPNIGRKSHFQRFWQKAKKARNLQENFAKKHVFLSLHQNTGRLFYSKEN